MKKVLVTGGYGYIGSHAIKALAEHGYEVSALDINQSSNDITKYLCSFPRLILNDVSYHSHGSKWFDVVVHLAGAISVEQSVTNPKLYTDINVCGTYNVVNNYESDNIIFASTAAAFDPQSPYAQTKLLAESIIRANAKYYTIFRFFNVAGSNLEFGQIGDSTHLIRIAAEAAAGKRDRVVINGVDWETDDGTCIRDYIHVEDLVKAIVRAVDKPSHNPYDCVGTGISYSVRQVIDAMKRVSGSNFNVVEGSRRLGDVAKITMNQPAYIKCSKTLEDMCESAFKYQLNRR